MAATITPFKVNALTLASIGGKMKAIFAKEEVAPEESTLATSQTMALFKPVVVEGTGGPETDASSSKVSLQAVSGSLRFSTEDIDFPTTDEISVYEVKKGDTLQDVAKLFGVSVNTIMWANDLKSKTISPGDTLIILPITGIKHTVKKGETVAGIAKKYKADSGDIAIYNGILEDATLAVGSTVIVPDGEIEVIQPAKPKASKPKTILATTPSGFLVRPIAGGKKTQGIHGNNGVDIAAHVGTPIVASASGKVIAARSSGYNGGYGSMVIISHANGVQTIYAHMNAVYVSQGQTVSQGQVIGEVGNTGRSTGPHIHFEVRGAKNPF